MSKQSDASVMRELEVLTDLIGFERACGVTEASPRDEWARPMDLGGSDCSDHSRVLRRLFKKGLVERWDRSLWEIRGSYLYHSTKAGRAYLKTASGPDDTQKAGHRSKPRASGSRPVTVSL